MRNYALRARDSGVVDEIRASEMRPALSPDEAARYELVEVPGDVTVGMGPGDHPALSSAEITIAAQIKSDRK